MTTIGNDDDAGTAGGTGAGVAGDPTGTAGPAGTTGAGVAGTAAAGGATGTPPGTGTAGTGGRVPGVPGALRAAAIASLGAGAIHATAAGAHSEHRGVVIAFAVTAALQIGWGALAISRAGRLIGLLGAAVNLGALGGWVLAKTSGIGFIEGLDVKESPQFADSLAAGLAAVAVIGAVLAVVDRVGWLARPRPALVGVAAVATLVLAVPGMVSTGSHDHGDGDHGGGDEHGHGDEAAAGHDDHGAGGDEHADHAAAEAKPYDATLPVDLGGTPGVSAEEQAEAEELVTISLQKLPQFADTATAEAMGYRSIRDGMTGFEHFMKWELIRDGKELDPDFPESLVYKVNEDGTRTLAAAMYMANEGTPLDDVPTVGGELVQWHIHDDLCFAGEPGAWHVAGVAPPPQECRPGTSRIGEPTPMVHVWIIPHECGPFSALEGVGAGQIQEGEERLCDHAHGAPA